MSKGAMLINFGSPSGYKEEDIKKFLEDVYSDPLVDDSHPLKKKFFSGSFIKKQIPEVAEAYEKVWKGGYSPLIGHSKKFQLKIQKRLNIPVELAMRHGFPGIDRAFQRLRDRGVDEILIIPMYPQYTMSTTWSAVTEVRILQDNYEEMKPIFLNSFYNHPEFITVLAEFVRDRIPLEFDKILFAYAGIPTKHELIAEQKAKRQPELKFKTYKEQCKITSELLLKELGIAEEKAENLFVPKYGKKDWTGPDFYNALKTYPQNGVKNVVVIAPGFVADCMETVYRIDSLGRSVFEKAGGENYNYISCLNDDQAWVELISKWIDDWVFKE